MSEQVRLPPEYHEDDHVTNQLIEKLRTVVNIPRGTSGLLCVSETQFAGQRTRSLELREGLVHIDARSVAGPDLSIYSPNAEIELLNVDAGIRGIGQMSCSVRNGKIEDVSYVDANDGRDHNTLECREEALALLELVIGSVEEHPEK